MKQCRRANPRIVLREEFEDSAILFDPDSGEIYGLNPVGVLVWKFLDGRHSVDEIASRIRHRFSDVPGQIRLEIDNFIADLARKGFIR